MQELYRDKPFYIIADSSTDSQGRNVLCVMIGICENHKFSKKHFLVASLLSDSTAQSYASSLMKAITDFFTDNLDYSKFKLLITDQAPNMLKTGRVLKEIFKSMKHVTCIVHLVHNLCEQVRKKCILVDSYVAIFKRLFVKNKTNQELFKQVTNLPIPKFSFITRWGI